MIPREDGEGLLDYLDRLNILAAERAGIETQVHALLLRLREAESAETQLARYLGLIEADQLGINSEKTDRPFQIADEASQSEAPAQTAPNASEPEPETPINSEINSDPRRQDLPTDAERVYTWALLQPGVFTAGDASDALGVNEKSAGNYLGQGLKRGGLERIEGTGISGVPSRYQVTRPDVAVLESEPEEEEPPYQLNRNRLSLDQRLLLEHLEKHGAMTQKLLCNQMNWSTSRADRAINELTRGGLLGRNGGLLVAIPAELVAAD